MRLMISRCRYMGTAATGVIGLPSMITAPGLNMSLNHGEPGTVYNVGGGNEKENLTVAETHTQLFRQTQVLDQVRHRPSRARSKVCHRLQPTSWSWLAAEGVF